MGGGNMGENANEGVQDERACEGASPAQNVTQSFDAASKRRVTRGGALTEISLSDPSLTDTSLADFSLTPVLAAHAPSLFPMIFQKPVTDTILWDGPTDLAAYQAGLKAKEEAVAQGKEHMFTIFVGGKPAGSCSFRPYEDGHRADVGLWIGAPFHGQGVGTFTVKELVRYGFQRPEIQKIEASVFCGNTASRRIFEKNDFQLEGTIRQNAKKRGQILDEWLLGLTRDDYEAQHALGR